MLPKCYCFLELVTKLSNVLCEKPVIHVELLLEMRIVVIHNREDGKMSVCKNALGK